MTKNLKVFQDALSEALYEFLRHRDDLVSWDNDLHIPSGYTVEIATGKQVYHFPILTMHQMEGVTLTSAMDWTQGERRGFTAQFMVEHERYRYFIVYNVPDETLMNVLISQAIKDDSEESQI